MAFSAISFTAKALGQLDLGQRLVRRGEIPVRVVRGDDANYSLVSEVIDRVRSGEQMRDDDLELFYAQFGSLDILNVDEY
jgi:hypothetical protein